MRVTSAVDAPPMQSTPIIRYAGTFRFAARESLEHALVRVRARIDEEQDLAALEGGWMRCFVMHDRTVTINLALPAMPRQRDAAAEIFAELSHDALEGNVTATIGDVAVEHYSVAPWRT
jgi:hypothetical protein